MKKLYFLKMLFALSLIVAVSQLASGQKKKILYVGADAYYAVIRSADRQMVDSLVYWGYDTAYMAMAVYDAGGGVNAGIDGVFFGESCGSNSVTPYGPMGDNFPVPAVALEAAAFGISDERWSLFKPESSAGALDGGGIVVHDIADATDNQVKITDNNHYITQIFDKDEIVTWSSSTAFAQVPYIQGVLYVKDILAIPVAAYTPPTNGETVMAMAMIENKFPKIKIFWFTCTHTLLNDALGTPDFYRMMKRACEYTFDNMPTAINEDVADMYDFVAFPNPSSGDVTIRFHANEPGLAQVILFDVTGKQVDVLYENMSPTGYNFVTLKGDRYQHGVYLIKLKLGDNTAYSKILLQ